MSFSELTAVFVILGIVILLVASALEAFWDFGQQVRADLKPGIFETQWSRVMLAGWLILLLVGSVFVFLGTFPLAALGAIVVYWLILPIVVGPRVRKRALPPWDDLKGELEKQGYTERNYWRHGDWWKAEHKRKPERKKKPESESDGERSGEASQEG